MLSISPEPNYHVRRLFSGISPCDRDNHSSDVQLDPEEAPISSTDNSITPETAQKGLESYSKSTETKLVRGTYVCTLYEKIIPMAAIFTYASPVICGECRDHKGGHVQCSEPGLCQRPKMEREYGPGTDKRSVIGLDPLLTFLENRVLKPSLLASSLGYDYTNQKGGSLLVCGQRNIGKRYCVQEFCRVNRFNYIGLDALGRRSGLVTDSVEFARALGHPAIIFLDQFDILAGQSRHAEYASFIGEVFHVLRSGALPPFVWVVLGSNLPSVQFYDPYKQELVHCGARELSVGHPQGTSDPDQRLWLLHTFVDSKTNGALISTPEDKANLSNVAQMLPAYSLGNLWKMLESKLADVVSRADFAEIIAASEKRTPEALRRVFFELVSAPPAQTRKRPISDSQVVSPAAVRTSMNVPVANPPFFYANEELGSGQPDLWNMNEEAQFAFDEEGEWN